MKVTIFVFIILGSNITFACDNLPSPECKDVQLESNELSQTTTDDCGSELCFCNCCNHISGLNFIIPKNNFENYSTPIIYESIHNLSDCFYSHWQPPKV